MKLWKVHGLGEGIIGKWEGKTIYYSVLFILVLILICILYFFILLFFFSFPKAKTFKQQLIHLDF